MSLTAMMVQCWSIAHTAKKLLKKNEISDKKFIIFLKFEMEEHLNWLPFTLPAEKETIVQWCKGEGLPGQKERRSFLEYVAKKCHDFYQH